MNKALILGGFVILTVLPSSNVSSNVNDETEEVIKEQVVENEVINNKVKTLLDEHVISIKQEEIIHELSSTINRKELYKIEQNAINKFGDDFFNYETKVKLMDNVENDFDKLEYESIYIDPFNILQVSDLTQDEFNVLLVDTPMENRGYVFELIEKELSVNGLFILALAQQESGLGNSNMAKQKNNLTGYAAYDYNTNAAIVFESFEHCLYLTARNIRNSYLLETGKFHHGTSIFDINVKYCSQIDWSIKIIDIMFTKAKLIENSLI